MEEETSLQLQRIEIQTVDKHDRPQPQHIEIGEHAKQTSAAALSGPSRTSWKSKASGAAETLVGDCEWLKFLSLSARTEEDGSKETQQGLAFAGAVEELGTGREGKSVAEIEEAAIS